MSNCNLELSNKLAEIFHSDITVLNGVFGINNIGVLRIYFNNHFFYSCNNKQLVLDYCQQVTGTKVFFSRRYIVR